MGCGSKISSLSYARDDLSADHLYDRQLGADMPYLLVKYQIRVATFKSSLNFLIEDMAQSLAQRQQILRELGVLSANLSQNETETPLWWIRQRIQSLFGI